MADEVPDPAPVDPADPTPLTTKMFRGAKATPRHMLARAMPFQRSATAPPPELARFAKKKDMWFNATYGICVTAEECYAKSADTPNVFINPNDELAWAEQHGFRDGAYLTEVMDAMTKRGIKAEDGKVYQDGDGRRAIDWTNRADLCDAISRGTVKIAVAADNLENAGAGNKDGWTGLNFYVDHNTDHCVSLTGYGSIKFIFDELNKAYGLNLSVPAGVDPKTFGYALFTWGSIGFVTEKSMVNITGEAWLRVPTTAGFDPTPVPPVPPVPPTPPGPTPTPVPFTGTTVWKGGTFTVTGLGNHHVTLPDQTLTVTGTIEMPTPNPTPPGPGPAPGPTDLDAAWVEEQIRATNHTPETLGLTPQQWQMIIQLILQLLPVLFPPKAGAGGSTKARVGKLTPEQWAAIIQLILKLLPLTVGG